VEVQAQNNIRKMILEAYAEYEDRAALAS